MGHVSSIESHHHRSINRINGGQMLTGRSFDLIHFKLIQFAPSMVGQLHCNCSEYPTGSQQFQSSFRATLERFRSSFRAVSGRYFHNSLRAISEQFQGSFGAIFRAVSEQFQSNFGAFSVKFQSSFRAILEQFWSNFGAI